MAKKKWYVVTIGRDVGVFSSWLEAAPLVLGVSGASHQSFASEEEAVDLFAQEYSKGRVRIVDDQGPATARPPQARPTTQQPRASSSPRASPAPSLLRVTPKNASGRTRSAQSSTLNVPIDDSSHLPSPTTGITQIYLTSSPSLSLHPPSSPTTGITQVYLSPTSSSSSSPSSVFAPELSPASTGTVLPQAPRTNPASSENMTAASVHLINDNSSRPIIINVNVPAQQTHCTHCRACGHDLNALTSRVAALDVADDDAVPRAVDPRSPLVSTRPSPRSALFAID